ncbi:hypothetical protein [Sulfurospirillum sp. 1612]|uniref:hypothetical protein n=1 Tax=Sulfurospirillum sp. 1612 TaxID=3094835 RepID=UPI002F953842
MRLFYMMVVACCFLNISMQGATYIYTQGKKSLFVTQQGVALYNGTPVQIISKKGQQAQIKIIGYVAQDDHTKLFATRNLSLLFAHVKSKRHEIQVSKDKGVLILSVPQKILTDDMDEAWEKNSDLFYDKCTKCHHAKVIKKHTMLEWSAIFSSMAPKAKISHKQDQLIMRFLKAFAKDGILKQSD